MSTEVIVNLRHEAQAYNEKCAEDSSAVTLVGAGKTVATVVLGGGVVANRYRPIELPKAKKNRLATCATTANEMGLSVKNAPAYCCDGYIFKNETASDRLLNDLKTAGVPDEFIQEYEYETYMRQRADSLKASAKKLSDGADRQELLNQAERCEEAAEKATGKERVVKVLNPKEVAKAHKEGRFVLPAGVKKAKLAAKMDDFKSSAVNLEDEIFRSFGKTAKEIEDIQRARTSMLKRMARNTYSWGANAAKAAGEKIPAVFKKIFSPVVKHPVISAAVVAGVWWGDEISDVSKEYIPFIGGSEQGGASLPAISEEILNEIEQNPEKYALDAEMAKTTVNNIRSTKKLDSAQYRAFYKKSEDISLEHKIVDEDEIEKQNKNDDGEEDSKNSEEFGPNDPLKDILGCSGENITEDNRDARNLLNAKRGEIRGA